MYLLHTFDSAINIQKYENAIFILITLPSAYDD